jgi:hypothetical protein
MGETATSNQSRGRVLWGIAGLAVSVIAIGGALTWRALEDAAQPPAGVPAEKAVPASQAPEIQRSRNSPASYGLPVYPGSFRFSSMGPGQGYGSAAFSVKKGTAADVVRFYVQELGTKGWQFRSREETRMPTPNGKTLPGLRAEWISQDKKRELSLITFDDAQADRTAQAVLAWQDRTAGRR